MRIHSVALKNFKSFGNDGFSEIIIEPSVTVIIGKNESGKSNIIEGISQIDFYTKKNAAFIEDKLNRNATPGSSISYEIIFRSTAEEMKKYNISKESRAIISEKGCKFSGGFCKHFKHVCGDSFSQFLDYIQQHPMRAIDNNVKNKLQALHIEENNDTWDVNRALATLQGLEDKVPGEEKEIFIKKLDAMVNDYFCAMSVLPTIFHRNEGKRLLNEYKYADVKTELKKKDAEKNSMLYNLLTVIEISVDDFLKAMQSNIQGPTLSLREKIQKAIDEKINRPFHKFYDEEKINLKIEFDSNIATFMVRAADGTAVLFSERSDGLRWYINMFIDALSQKQRTDHAIYLFDEPGLSLHVNAQKKLMELFDDLTKQSKGNQVIYTTHSPYMLNTSQRRMERIRAVVKDEDEISRIYKTPYDQRITSRFKEDTLAPLMAALGMNLSDTFGPAKDKLTVVLEGISDEIFLISMAKVLGYDLSRYSFIPATGVSSCVNISIILCGWGCKNVILFDYDKEGVERGGKVVARNYGFELGKQYIYIQECTGEEIDKKSYKMKSVEIEDLVPDLNKFLKESNCASIDGKPLRAKYYTNAIEDGSYECPKETINNFRELFERLDKCFEKQN